MLLSSVFFKASGPWLITGEAEFLSPPSPLLSARRLRGFKEVLEK